jgi:hypothetical protein
MFEKIWIYMNGLKDLAWIFFKTFKTILPEKILLKFMIIFQNSFSNLEILNYMENKE